VSDDALISHSAQLPVEDFTVRNASLLRKAIVRDSSSHYGVFDYPHVIASFDAVFSFSDTPTRHITGCNRM
jgi:hypothetical protein